MTIEPFGKTALTYRLAVEPSRATSRRLQGLQQVLTEQPGVIEAWAGLTEVMVECRNERVRNQLLHSKTLKKKLADPVSQLADDKVVAADEPTTHCLEVVYDGADLQTVAETLGTSAEVFIEAHSQATYDVLAVGFQPGFAYLQAREASARWSLPRKTTPVVRVPPGSLAVAAGFTGIYPHASPAGWYLIGRTLQSVFDAHAAQSGLFAVGDVVRFVQRVET